MKKVLMYIALFFAIGTILTVVGLTVLDNFIYSLSQSSSVAELNSTGNGKNELKASNKLKIEDGATSVQYSFNNKYYSYLKDGKVHINTVSDGKSYATIEETKNICYYNLLYDKNLIVYITEETVNNTSTRLVINTYDIASKRKIQYNKFNVANFSSVKDMNMSPIINIIYINIETKTGTKMNNTIYRVDLFNSMSQVKSGTIFEKMIMLQHKDRVYYEDTKSNIYSSAGTLGLFKTKVEMIGIDEEDNLYFLTKDTKSTVYKVSNNKIIDTIKLSDTNVVKTYTNNFGTYLIYPTYVINVAAEDPYRRIGRLSEYVEFEAIKDDTMYLRTKDNILVTTKVLVDEADTTGNVTE